MKNALRNGALALALLAGSTLVAAPAMADRGYDHHWSKKHKYGKHGKYDRRDYYGRKGHGRYGWDRRYGRNGWYGYGGGPRYGYWPYSYRSRPGFSIQIY